MAATPEDTIHETARDACRLWPIEPGKPELLKFRENGVFRVRLRTGQPAALRIHRLGYHSDAALRSELQWMAYLRSSGIEAPEPIASERGDFLAHVIAPDGKPRQVDCLSWLDGQTLGQAAVPLPHTDERLGEIFHALGKTIALMHNATARWQKPPGFERHRWDFAGFFGENPTWGPFHTSPLLDVAGRDVVARGRAKAMNLLSSYHTTDRNVGLIHADLVRENLLVSGKDVKLIDFDDCGYGWHMYDLGVALYQNRIEPAYPLIEEALLDGYRSRRELSEADLEMLPTFVALRAFALLGWMQSRMDNDTSRLAGAQISALACSAVQEYLDRA